ncbi:MAG TPA: hypothetical protein VLX58_12255, partial [Bryobacteraceae bacterium]|nr:hypothetical protein [Bryobacteraceae bacterium]
FQDDDLDTLSWARDMPGWVLLDGLLTPRLPLINFRPVGAFYYHVMAVAFGLDFPKYLVPLQALHILNICLLWWLARKLGIGPLAAAAGAFFFGLNAVLFDAWWKPMYVYDVSCATLCLITLVLYTYDHWILSLAAFWLACKSKELAVLLPAVLVCYELWLGKKRWLRLLPFLGIALLFGLQGLILRPRRGTVYELRLGLEAQRTTLSFYASRLLFLPYAGALLLALPFAVRDRRLWFGFALTCLPMIPLLLLPGRLFPVYWYVPLTGVAIMLATIAQSRYRVAAAVFLLLWIPWDFVNFREERRTNQRRERQNQAYVSEIARFARLHPGQRHFVYDALPEEFHSWGVNGALNLIYRTSGIQAQYIDEPGAEQAVQRGEAALLHWYPVLARLAIVEYPKVSETLSYLRMNEQTPPAQLPSGWYRPDEDFRWTQPDATAVLLRPQNVHSFELEACVSPEQIRRHGVIELRVLLDARLLGRHEFTAPGCQTLRWAVPHGPAGMSNIEFHATPAFHPAGDPRVLGIAVKGCGFHSE